MCFDCSCFLVCQFLPDRAWTTHDPKLVIGNGPKVIPVDLKFYYMTTKTDSSVQYFANCSLNSKLSVWCFSPLQYGNLYCLWSHQIDKLALSMYGSTFISFPFSLQEGSNVIHICSDKITLLIPPSKTRNLRPLYKGNQGARTLIHTWYVPREQKVVSVSLNEGENEEYEEGSVWLMTAYVKVTLCSKFGEVSKM
jgi:hypothetical protein